MEVTPSQYSIMSGPWGASHGRHPRSWCLEMSGDGQSWTDVHWCDNNRDLNGINQIGTYSITREVRSRSVRLRQAGKTHYNDDHLVLSGFEVFDILDEWWIWVNLHIARCSISSSRSCSIWGDTERSNVTRTSSSSEKSERTEMPDNYYTCSHDSKS
jgi:hypothetical protein